MSLLGEIDKLINERGSAAILREKVGLLELQRSHAIEQRDATEAKLTAASGKVRELEIELSRTRQQLEDARENLKRLGGSQQDQLPTESEKMLAHIANARSAVTCDQVIKHFGLSKAKGEFLFDQLLERKYVYHTGGQIGVGWFYDATSEGRKYLARTGQL